MNSGLSSPNTSVVERSILRFEVLATYSPQPKQKDACSGSTVLQVRQILVSRVVRVDSFSPHAMQNLSAWRTRLVQHGQSIASFSGATSREDRRSPHSLQKFAFSRFSAEQCGHRYIPSDLSNAHIYFNSRFPTTTILLALLRNVFSLGIVACSPHIHRGCMSM